MSNNTNISAGAANSNKGTRLTRLSQQMQSPTHTMAPAACQQLAEKQRRQREKRLNQLREARDLAASRGEMFSPGFTSHSSPIFPASMAAPLAFPQAVMHVHFSENPAHNVVPTPGEARRIEIAQDRAFNSARINNAKAGVHFLEGVIHRNEISTRGEARRTEFAQDRAFNLAKINDTKPGCQMGAWKKALGYVCDGTCHQRAPSYHVGERSARAGLDLERGELTLPPRVSYPQRVIVHIKTLLAQRLAPMTNSVKKSFFWRHFFRIILTFVFVAVVLLAIAWALKLSHSHD